MISTAGLEPRRATPTTATTPRRWCRWIPRRWRSSPRRTGSPGDFATLSQSPEVRADIQADDRQLNAQLNRWETIKKFTILDRDLSEEDGELTASLKVKRKVVEEHFADQIEAMYA